MNEKVIAFKIILSLVLLFSVSGNILFITYSMGKEPVLCGLIGIACTLVIMGTWLIL